MSLPMCRLRGSCCLKWEIIILKLLLILEILCLSCFRFLRQPSVSTIAVTTNCQHPNTLQNSKQPMRGEYSESPANERRVLQVNSQWGSFHLRGENMKWKSQNIAGPGSQGGNTWVRDIFMPALTQQGLCQGEWEGERNSFYLGTQMNLD